MSICTDAGGPDATVRIVIPSIVNFCGRRDATGKIGCWIIAKSGTLQDIGGFATSTRTASPLSSAFDSGLFACTVLPGLFAKEGHKWTLCTRSAGVSSFPSSAVLQIFFMSSQLVVSSIFFGSSVIGIFGKLSRFEFTNFRGVRGTLPPPRWHLQGFPEAEYWLRYQSCNSSLRGMTTAMTLHAKLLMVKIVSNQSFSATEGASNCRMVLTHDGD